jgi:asparagine synthetase A
MGWTVAPSYTLAVAQDEDMPQLIRPEHVNERDWEIRLSDYDTALARYDSAVAAIDNQMRQGLLPTSAHQQAERSAQNALSLARGALLSLYRHPTERH